MPEHPHSLSRGPLVLVSQYRARQPIWLRSEVQVGEGFDLERSTISGLDDATLRLLVSLVDEIKKHELEASRITRPTRRLRYCLQGLRLLAALD